MLLLGGCEALRQSGIHRSGFLIIWQWIHSIHHAIWPLLWGEVASTSPVLCRGVWHQRIMFLLGLWCTFWYLIALRQVVPGMVQAVTLKGPVHLRSCHFLLNAFRRRDSTPVKSGHSWAKLRLCHTAAIRAAWNSYVMGSAAFFLE